MDRPAGGPGDFGGRGIERLLHRAQIATSQPSIASARMIAVPMPSLPPVTMAVLPSV